MKAIPKNSASDSKLLKRTKVRNAMNGTPLKKNNG
jgi:hypothetical protein